MKREGRQHGSVRIYPIIEAIPLSQQRYVKNNTVDPANVTGMFTKVSGKPTKSLQRYVENNMVVPCYVFGMYTKVSGKPTNQSKFTGKCYEDHFYPATKAKDKVKGTMKWRSIEESDPELVSCGAGASATRAFAYLAGEGSYDDHDEYEGEIDVYESDDDSDTTFDEYEGELGIVSEEPIRVEGYSDVGLCWAEGDAQESQDDEWCLVE
ncbi:hypothetical protein Tco_0373950 [Tanacetum coccineum]